MFIPNTNFFEYCENSYLSKCDQINKLSPKSFRRSRQIKNVILSLCLGEASSTMNDSSFKDKRLISFLMLYLIGFRKPISFVSRPTEISDKNFFKLEILLSKKSGMNEFLLDLFLEDRLILKEEFEVETDEFNKRLTRNNATLLKTQINLESFLSMSRFVDKESVDIRFKKLELIVEVVVQNFEVEMQN